jgi:hypothetical protein
MSKKSLIQDALSTLSTSKPLVLPKAQSFAPPQATNSPKDEMTPTDEKLTQGQKTPYPEGVKIASPSGQNMTQVKNIPTEPNAPREINQAYPEGTKSPSSSDENNSQAAKSPEVVNTPQDENLTQVVNADENEIPLLESPDNPIETSPRPSKEERIALSIKKLSNGYTTLPNSILMELISGSHTKAEIKIMLLTARFTISFKRETAPLSKADFVNYCCLQGSNVLDSVASLEKKNLIKKKKGDQYSKNQLGLNFEASLFDWLPPSNTPKKPTESPEAGPPEEQKPPQDENCSHPEGVKSLCPSGEKNSHFKRSSSNNNLENSLSSDFRFPDDMNIRWENLEKSGIRGVSKNEREIFNEMFLKHGKQFFDLCGSVIQFLEEQGTGKPGENQKVHSPMIYIRNHWDINRSRYEAWLQKQELLKVAETARTNQEKIALEQDNQARLNKQKEEAKLLEAQSKRNQEIEGFLRTLPIENERMAFIEKAILESKNQFLHNSWTKSGWDSVLVQNYVLRYFEETNRQLSKFNLHVGTVEVSA